MKRFLLMMIALCMLTTPAVAASVVYLKDGGKIRAKSVWKSQGRVYVLVNRDSITDFSPAEINMKRTFAHKRHIAKKQEPAVASQTTTSTAPSAVEAGSQKTGSKLNSLINKLPSMPEKTPESLVPSSGSGGTIKKHKKEMAERANE